MNHYSKKKEKKYNLDNGNTVSVYPGKWQQGRYGYQFAKNGNLRKWYDWMDDEKFETTIFYRHHARYYCLDDFMVSREWNNPAQNWMEGWDGYSSDSYFSGVLIKYRDSDEYAMLATYIG